MGILSIILVPLTTVLWPFFSGVWREPILNILLSVAVTGLINSIIAWMRTKDERFGKLTFMGLFASLAWWLIKAEPGLATLFWAVSLIPLFIFAWRIAKSRIGLGRQDGESELAYANRMKRFWGIIALALIPILCLMVTMMEPGDGTLSAIAGFGFIILVVSGIAFWRKFKEVRRLKGESGLAQARKLRNFWGIITLALGSILCLMMAIMRSVMELGEGTLSAIAGLAFIIPVMSGIVFCLRYWEVRKLKRKEEEGGTASAGKTERF